ncbi:hypothetical protein PF005_g25756 [Phytophthora fragariae]|uniref:Phosphatidylinositol-specific phospholipase C X domain-containing protein n=1 Tax=Phytophthora fragariae TaxID=53985 RepID=A0A6A3VWS5_9STRA|nr:hypothetical protein PF003_g37181 [Phytophthora fragariae]KAE8923265.1 hypothetical protein PF009_g26485 [Phytophthora fragariae]KAE8975233.1 hypothetical protein PF011_g24562 [Phytophthora fragariae]KAE9074958.1 hypothetical protein PF007_g25200 [Phytophthora fragariae]KAE9087911.1 hypothetical protein PF006_g25702 [Phytophthora fragariae]
MNLRRFAASVFVGFLGFTSTSPQVQVQAQECKAKDNTFGFLVDKLPTAYGLNTCVANNVGTIGRAIASTIFSSCGMLDVYDVVKNKDLTNLFTLFKDIAAKPGDMSPIIYNYMAAQNDDSVDNLCDAFSGALGPCGQKVLPKLIPAFQKDNVCCGEISDLIDLLNIVVPPTKNQMFFILNELIDGFNRFLCSKKGDNSCGLDMFQQLTKMYTVDNFDFFEHMVMPFMTVGQGEECSGLAGNPYKNTASQKSATTINFGCCVHQMRPLIQTIQSAVKNVVSDEMWDIASGMVSFTAPNGFVDTLTGTTSCEFDGDSCKDPKGITDDVDMTREVGSKEPGKNDLVDTKCTLEDKCSGDKSVCSQVCKRGSVVVPDWLKSTLAYQRNLANSGPFCFAQIPASHNSAITLADGFGNRDQLFNKNLNPDKWYSYLKTNNQVLSMTDQLDIGIRFIEIDTHFFLNDLHTGHCGNLGSDAVAGFFAALGRTLGNYGKYNWGPELLGCFPSISGIKASEQPLTKDSMDEIKAWLNANPTEFVVVYLDTGSDIKRSDKFGAIDTLFTDTFGDLLVPLSALDDLAKGKWTGGSINDFINAGHQVLALTNAKTEAAYSLYDMCTAEKDLTVEFIDDLPDAKRQINGITIYSNTNWIRSWSEQLRYISLAATGALTHKFPVFLDAESIPKYLRWNLNLIALDNADVAKMAAQVWSWAENEPSTTVSGAYVLMDKDGRWVASTKAKKGTRACWDSSKLAWSIVDFAKGCPTGTAFTAPTDPYQNYLLHEALVAQKIADTSLVINATLTAVGAPTPVPSEVAVITDDAPAPAPAEAAATDGSSEQVPSGLTLCRSPGACGPKQN